MVSSCSISFTDFGTLFVLVVGPLLLLSVISTTMGISMGKCPKSIKWPKITFRGLIWVPIPRNCHTYLVEEVLAAGVANLEASLLLRFHGFFKGLLASPSHEVAVVALLAARDRRSTFGSNLTHLREMTGLNPWTVGRSQLKTALELALRREVPVQDLWRPQLLQKLLSARSEAHYSADLVEEERIATLIKLTSR